jgi:hypothetical protein
MEFTGRVEKVTRRKRVLYATFEDRDGARVESATFATNGEQFSKWNKIYEDTRLTLHGEWKLKAPEFRKAGFSDVQFIVHRITGIVVRDNSDEFHADKALERVLDQQDVMVKTGALSEHQYFEWQELLSEMYEQNPGTDREIRRKYVRRWDGT